MQAAFILFILIFCSIMAIIYAIWLVLGVKQWWEWHCNQPPEVEIYSSASDSLSK